ncbi:MAG: LytTR family DNA-binding domain-containing protein [Lachnospiraceae bacterium]|nr:LytTR family DNA-binding domain-containing protein [Lachnospiraceae bacterium]
MYQIAICDDEISELDKVEQMLQNYHTQHMEGELLLRRFLNSEELLLQMTTKSYQPDLIMLDIYQPGKSGIETARKLRDRGASCKIVFLTSSQKHALEAFGVEAVSYLVKPVSEKELFPVLDKVLKEFVNEQPRYILLQTDDCVRRIKPNDILYCEAQRKKQYVCMKEDESIFLHMTMGKLFELLCIHKEFAKLGASYIVNLEHIERLGTQMLLMDNGKEIYLPRGSYKELREKYFDHYLGTGHLHKSSMDDFLKI